MDNEQLKKFQKLELIILNKDRSIDDANLREIYNKRVKIVHSANDTMLTPYTIIFILTVKTNILLDKFGIEFKNTIVSLIEDHSESNLIIAMELIYNKIFNNESTS